MPDPKSLGGPAACEPPFVAELRRQGCDVTEETYVYGEGLQGTSLMRRARRVLNAIRRLNRSISQQPIDIIHINSAFDARALLRDFVTLKLLRKTQAKIFIKFHGSDAGLLQTTNPLLVYFQRFVLDRVSGIGVLSSEEKRNFSNARVADNKIFVVKNVVDLTFPLPRDSAATTTPIILFIARFIPAKGLLDVIRACSLLQKQGVQFQLVCVGDGPAKSDAVREVQNLRLENQVHFTGFISEAQARAFYVTSTVVVLPTYHGEGFPMTIFSAAAAGRPIVTTRIRAAADYLSEPENCLWVNPHDPTDLAMKLKYLISEPELRARMGSNNYELAKSFSAEQVTREYLKAYKALLSGVESLQTARTEDLLVDAVNEPSGPSGPFGRK